MRIVVSAVGRLRRGPEADLFREYCDRTNAIGGRIGLGPVSTTEVDERKAQDKSVQGRQLDGNVPQGAYRIALDERGTQFSSVRFADQLARLRDQGTPSVAFLIGGADGLSKEIRDTAELKLSFGPMVWPHMLARVMLSEQIYRATSILAGSPYHRA